MTTLNQLPYKLTTKSSIEKNLQEFNQHNVNQLTRTDSRRINETRIY